MRFSRTPRLVSGIAFVVVGISRGIHQVRSVDVTLLDTFGWSGATARIFSVPQTIDPLVSPVGYRMDRDRTRRMFIAGYVPLHHSTILLE
jgi:hypothetical protein